MKRVFAIVSTCVVSCGFVSSIAAAQSDPSSSVATRRTRGDISHEARRVIAGRATSDLTPPPSPSSSFNVSAAVADLGDIKSWSLSAPPSDAVDRAGDWLNVSVAVTTQYNGGFIHAAWEAYMLQAVLAERLGGPDDLSDRISGSTIMAQLPNGEEVPVGGGASSTPAGRQLDGWQDDSELEAHVRSVVGSVNGLHVDQLAILHPLGRAVGLVVTARDPSVLAGKVPELESDIAGVSPSIEGLYLEIDSSGGVPILRNGIAYRADSGSLWQDPKDTTNFGIGHG